MQLITFFIFFAAFFASMTTSAPIEARSGHSGDATYYTPGLGSCGQTNSESDMVVALSSSQMSGGGKCGSSITVKSASGSVTVTVVDTCPGCSTDSVDLSPAAFEKIGQLSAGRIPVTW